MSRSGATRSPRPRTERIERGDGVVRTVSATSGWNAVTWSDLDGDPADAAIAEEVGRFALGGPWEWKHYSYDLPFDLPERLLAADSRGAAGDATGRRDRALALDAAPHGRRAVSGHRRARVEALVRVHDQVFGGGHARETLPPPPRRGAVGPWSRWPGTPVSAAGWSSTPAPTSRACGAAAP